MPISTSYKQESKFLHSLILNRFLFLSNCLLSASRFYIKTFFCVLLLPEKKGYKKWNFLNSAHNWESRKITQLFYFCWTQTYSSSWCVHFSCIFLSIYSICEIIFFLCFTLLLRFNVSHNYLCICVCMSFRKNL